MLRSASNCQDFLVYKYIRNIKKVEIKADKGLWSCCCTLTFRILHFEVYDILKCKNFLIGFLDKLGNFKYINSIDLENSKILQLAKS